MDINDTLSRNQAYKIVAIASVLNHFGLPGQARKEITDNFQQAGIVRGADNWFYGATVFEEPLLNTNLS